MRSGIIILSVAVVVLLAWIVRIYNRLVMLRNRWLNGFSQIDVQLKRRHDLIPNLVETARGYMKHERDTLEKVIAARNAAASATAHAAAHPRDAGAISSLVSAETVLSGNLRAFFGLVENYPDLKANQVMARLMEELTSTENRIAFARQAYNDAVTLYNIFRQSFPNNLLAGPLGMGLAELFEFRE